MELVYLLLVIVFTYRICMKDGGIVGLIIPTTIVCFAINKLILEPNIGIYMSMVVIAASLLFRYVIKTKEEECLA